MCTNNEQQSKPQKKSLPMTLPLKRCVVAHINFPHALHSFNDLRHVQQLFAKVGRLVAWKDFMTSAGYKHHMGRSMAVFEVGDSGDSMDESLAKFQSLRAQLERTVGVVTPRDLSALVNGQQQEISIQLEKGDMASLKAIIEDPFFKVSDHSTALKTRLDWSECIPMVVRTQELGASPSSTNPSF